MPSKTSIKSNKNNINNDTKISNKNIDNVVQNDKISKNIVSNKLVDHNNNSECNLSDDNIIFPYKTVVLPAPVVLEPIQLNGKFEHNIKLNLINTHEGKCFEDYGFITKIYKIVTHTKPIIEPESSTCTPITNVKFVHELCMPINDKFMSLL